MPSRRRLLRMRLGTTTISAEPVRPRDNTASDLGIMRRAERKERRLEGCKPTANQILLRSAGHSARALVVHRGADSLQRSEHIRHANTVLLICRFLAQPVQGPGEVIRAALDVRPVGIGGPITGGQAVGVGDPHGVK